MRRRSVAFTLLLLSLLVSASCWCLIAKAAPLRQQVQVYVTSPEMGAEVRGLVEIRGSALVPSFQFYKVEFGVGPNPVDWSVIGSLHSAPVVNDVLEVWNTTALPDSEYTLRLQGVKQDGNWEEFIVRGIRIRNTSPTATPVPTVLPTQTSMPTEPATPEPTFTPRVIGFSDLQVPAQTPTPTLSRPDLRERLPFDPQAWGQSLCFGGVAMIAVFAVLGVVFGVRRLL